MPLSVRLLEDLEARLTKLPKRTGRSKSYYVTRAIREHLANIEDGSRAKGRLPASRPDRAESLTLEELLAKHGPTR